MTVKSPIAQVMLATICRAEIKCNLDYPGGNGKLDKIEGNDIYFQQDLRSTKIWWFYWNFELENVAGKTLRIHFTNKNALETAGPAFSFDDGQTWQWLGSYDKDDKYEKENAIFSHTIPADVSRVRYCHSIPYQRSNLDTLISRYKNKNSFLVEKLTSTLEGRENLLIKIGEDKNKKYKKYKIAITARHHACETTASWVLDGLIEEIMSDSHTGIWLRENCSFFIVPLVDLDGVENGDQGKSRSPHDHNRDYNVWLYPDTKALADKLTAWANGHLDIALDMHCPFRDDNRIFFVQEAAPHMANNTQKFSSLLAGSKTSPLEHTGKHDIPFGQEWNTHTPNRFSTWIAEKFPSSQFSTTLEIGYSRIGNIPATTPNTKLLGQALAETLAAYLPSY